MRCHGKTVPSVCTDGAAAMVGKYSGVVAYIKNMNSEIVHIHCLLYLTLLYQHALAVK